MFWSVAREFAVHLARSAWSGADSFLRWSAKRPWTAAVACGLVAVLAYLGANWLGVCGFTAAGALAVYFGYDWDK